MYEIVSSLCDIQTGTDLLVAVALDNVIIKLTDLLLFFFVFFLGFVCFSVLIVGFQVPKMKTITNFDCL